MRTTLRHCLAALGCTLALAGATGCEYFATRQRGASYFAYPAYYYSDHYRPRPNIYVPPLARGGGPGAAQ